MPYLRDLIPDAKTVIEMDPSDLGGYILESLLNTSDHRGGWSALMKEHRSPMIMLYLISQRSVGSSGKLAISSRSACCKKTTSVISPTTNRATPLG